jgi:ABC-type bacteriocin/lantibiotic exporter with double-glycine peptidase domain
MDCGPACLKSLLEGFGVPVSYGRLREACQTDVDGTSIDVIEDVANQLGLEAEQILVPLDHVFLPETESLPALAVWRNPDAAPHFVVLWRAAFGRVMVMDPSSGRKWLSSDEVSAHLYHHGMPLPAEAWREWAGSTAFTGSLRRRLSAIGAWGDGARALEAASADPTATSLAALDAATRLVSALVRSEGIAAGGAAGRLVVSLAESARTHPEAIPRAYWSARPFETAEDGTPRVLGRGAVLVRVLGARRRAADAPPLNPELEAALREPGVRPIAQLLRFLREDGALTPIAITLGLSGAAIGGAIEALLLRGLLEVGRHLGLVEQRAGALVVLFTLLLVLLAIELPTAGAALRIGRKLETRMRVAFLSKIPRLTDRYFQSRPISDMAQRIHAIHPVRRLPTIASRLIRSVLDLLVVSAGLVWIDPRGLPLVATVAAISIAVPWVTQSVLIERDQRVRSYDGALTRYYLDALLGIIAIRTHGADRALRSEHAQMLGEWARANRDRLRTVVLVDALEQIVGAILAIWLAFDYLAHVSEPAALLLLFYWALSVPTYGQEIGAAARDYPAIRNLLLRIAEPLGAIEESDELTDTSVVVPGEFYAVQLAFHDVTIRVSGRDILTGVNLEIPAGEHVGIVGPSGAGKSSFVGLLLGWHRAAHGVVEVDGEPLRGARLRALRRETTWVDPAVQLWNRSLLDNLAYGAIGESSLAQVLEQADLVALLERLPDGLQTELGEGGALVSGGEGQRVRLGRAMMRPDSKLVILDEPFRGLDRDKRVELLARARKVWKRATLLCATHDVGETLDLDRVLVVEDGRIVEEGAPRALAKREGSRYRAMLDAEDDVRRRMWGDASFRRLVMRGGELTETPRRS